MRVVVTGASGFIGSALSRRLLARGDEVTALSRRPDAPGLAQDVRWVGWDPDQDGAWQAELDGAGAVVHLAGETAAGRRYTRAVREAIVRSRVATSRKIVEGIARAGQKPRVLVCASGVGYYGAHGDEPLDEAAAPGKDFLAELCVTWEGEAKKAEGSGVRVVSTRIGFVLGLEGGALARLLPLFKVGLGGPLGNGRQVLSFIHLDDLCSAMLFALDHPTLSGPVNLTAPNAVTSRELARTLGRVLHRPSVMPAPGFGLRLLFGEGAEALLTGQRAVPRALLDAGFRFEFEELEPALRDLLDKE